MSILNPCRDNNVIYMYYITNISNIYSMDLVNKLHNP